MGFGMSAAMLYHWRGISSSLSKIFTGMGISLLLFVVWLSLPRNLETKGHAHEWMIDQVRQSHRRLEA
jgi:type II secretory pathway component PulM